MVLNVDAKGHNFQGLGRFVRLRAWPNAGSGPGTLLDRPFSIFYFMKDTVSFYIREAGPATALLSSLVRGSQIRLIGPLGQGLDDVVPDYKDKKW